MPKPKVIDLSHHNTIKSDLSGAVGAGIVGVIHKLTEGKTFVDPTAKARQFLSKQAGLEWGLYHFLRPGNMDEQLRFFLAHTDSLSDEKTLLAVDYEDAAVSLDDLKVFLKGVENSTSKMPILYAGNVLKEKLGTTPDPELSRYRLWLAQYSTAPKLPAGWNNCWLWQYTQNGSIPGITPAVDLSEYTGADETLRQEWSGTFEEVVPDNITSAQTPPLKVQVTNDDGSDTLFEMSTGLNSNLLFPGLAERDAVRSALIMALSHFA